MNILYFATKGHGEPSGRCARHTKVLRWSVSNVARTTAPDMGLRIAADPLQTVSPLC